MNILEVARQYRAAGLSVIPCKNKRPVIGTWSEYQNTIPTDADLERMFGGTNADQIAVICGKVSGGLEVIDLDLKNDKKGYVWDRLWNDMCEYFNNHMPLLVINTPSGGAHLYYRCDEIAGNQKLAKQEGQKEAIIETRGEGGYVIAPPSVGSYPYPAKPGYQFADQGQDMTAIHRITPEQRTDILDICRKYNEVFVVERKKTPTVQASAYKDTPWDAYNADQAEPWSTVLGDAGWEISYTDKEGREHWKRPGSENKTSANWDPVRRLFYVFTTSSDFESHKAYPPFAIYAVLKCAGDYSEATRQIRALGYGKPFSEKDEEYIAKATGLLDKGLTHFDIMSMLMADYIHDSPEVSELGKAERKAVATADLEIIVNAAGDRHAASKGLFWKIAAKGKISISKDGLKTFLREHGYRLFVQEAGSELYRIVRIDADTRIIEEIPEDEVMKWVERWINDNIDDYEVSRSELLESLTNFKDWHHIIKWMERVSITDFSFIRDTRTVAYLPFRNGIVRIDKDDIRITPYSDLPDGMLVWRNQIKPVDIEIMGIKDGDDLALNESPVFRFIKRIAGVVPELENMPLADLLQQYPVLYTRLMAFITTGGYLMSNYKDPGRPYAIFLGEDTPTDKEGGGAGKDLYMKILKWIRGISFMPGKTWKPTANFAFQSYRLGDDIFYIGDAGKNFNYEVLHNMISEGMTIEKKNKDALTIPYDLSPKIAVSSNYYLDDSSTHISRRWFKLLFAKYYNDRTLRVEDELGGLFWSENWTQRDWMMFYLIPFTMIQMYLDIGIVRFDETENMKAKKVKSMFTPEFFDWMQNMADNEMGKWFVKKELYDQFLYDTDFEKKEYGTRKFWAGVDFYGKLFGITISEHRNKKRKTGDRDTIYIILHIQGSEVPKFEEPGQLWD